MTAKEIERIPNTKTKRHYHCICLIFHIDTFDLTSSHYIFTPPRNQAELDSRCGSRNNEASITDISKENNEVRSPFILDVTKILFRTEFPYSIR